MWYTVTGYHQLRFKAYKSLAIRTPKCAVDLVIIAERTRACCFLVIRSGRSRDLIPARDGGQYIWHIASYIHGWRPWNHSNPSMHWAFGPWALIYDLKPELGSGLLSRWRRKPTLPGSRVTRRPCSWRRKLGISFITFIYAITKCHNHVRHCGLMVMASDS